MIIVVCWLNPPSYLFIVIYSTNFLDDQALTSRVVAGSSYDRMVYSLPSFISWLRKATKVRWTHKKFAQNNWKGSGFTYFSHVRYYYTIPLMSCPHTLSGQYFPTPFPGSTTPLFFKRGNMGSNFTWERSNLIIWTDNNLSWLSVGSFEAVTRGNDSTVCLLFVARRVVTFVGEIMIKSQSGCSLLDIWGRKGELVTCSHIFIMQFMMCKWNIFCSVTPSSYFCEK